MMCEFPTRQVEPDEWRVLFAWAGYTRHRDDDEHGRRWPRRRKPIRLYRGAHEDRRLGWSWTTSVSTARWFASRDLGHGTGQVWETTVDPGLLLAQIDGRNEHEYVDSQHPTLDSLGTRPEHRRERRGRRRARRRR